MLNYNYDAHKIQIVWFFLILPKIMRVCTLCLEKRLDLIFFFQTRRISCVGLTFFRDDYCYSIYLNESKTPTFFPCKAERAIRLQSNFKFIAL